MIFHLASMAAVFVDQLAQAPVQIQCVQQSTPESWLKWLLPTGQTIIPVAGGVLVAWMAFRWNKNKEHEQWVRDHKKSEWQELLMLASAIECFMPSVAIGGEIISAVHDPTFNQHLRDMTRAALKCLFVSKSKIQKIYQMLDDIQISNERAKAHIEDFRSDANLAYRLGKPMPLQAAKRVQFELGSLWREVRRLASEDLELEPYKSWLESLTDWLKKPHRQEVEDKPSQDAPTDAD
jgi:hypothetical protein